MPRKARELSALDVKRARHPGTTIHPVLIPVGGVDGLYLQIRPEVDGCSARSWKLRAMVGTQRRHIGLGPYPEVGLAEARTRAREARDAVRRGEDPIALKRVAKAALIAEQGRFLTFAAAVDKFLADKGSGFKNEKHRAQWGSTLATYANPVLGRMAVDTIETKDVLRVLRPIWETKPETASRLRGRIERVLAWAEVSGHRSGDNPAAWRGRLDAILPAMASVKRVEHQPALALGDAAEWFAALRAKEGVSARALELVALTAARSGEVRGARWSEIDLEAGVWTIPASRMKAGKEHRAALSKDAVELLRALPRTEGVDLVFPSSRQTELSDMTLTQLMRRINAGREGGFLDARSGRPAVVHGLRSAFRDWCAEAGVDRDLAEMALAHSVGSAVERAYRRTDLFARRRSLMARWAEFLRGERGQKVTVLRP